jgi:hypothetical protein
MTIVAEITLRQPPKLHQLGIVIGQKAKLEIFIQPARQTRKGRSRATTTQNIRRYITEKGTQGCAAFKS